MNAYVDGLDLPDRIWMERARISALFMSTYTAIGMFCLCTANPVTEIYTNGGLGIHFAFWVMLDFVCIGCFFTGIKRENRWMMFPIVVKEGVECVIRSILLIGFTFIALFNLTLNHQPRGGNDDALFGLMMISALLAPFHILMFYCFYKYFCIISKPILSPPQSPLLPQSPPPAYDVPPPYEQ